ncbi:MAG: hypothetical protein U0270_13405 [Labilithrix sp.]
MRGRLAVILLALASCKSKPAPSTEAVGATSAGPPSPSALAAAKQRDEVMELTLAWNDAHARRDAAALRKVYAEQVRLYEAQLDRDAAIKQKEAAFKAAPSYAQSIRSLSVDRSQPGRPTVQFMKTWSTDGKEKQIGGVLVFAIENGHPRVVEESDVAADQKRLAKLDTAGCWGLAHAAVASTPSGRDFTRKDMGTIIECAPPECPGIQVAGTAFSGSPPAMHKLAYFDVDYKKGVVMRGESEEPADPAIIERLKKACAAEYP